MRSGRQCSSIHSFLPGSSYICCLAQIHFSGAAFIRLTTNDFAFRRLDTLTDMVVAVISSDAIAESERSTTIRKGYHDELFLFHAVS